MAAEQGDIDAQYYVRQMYIGRNGVTQNYKKAFNWFRLCAEKDYYRAQMVSGMLYEKGIGTNKNYKNSAEMYKKALVNVLAIRIENEKINKIKERLANVENEISKKQKHITSR
jgi:hypothetical protein